MIEIINVGVAVDTLKIEKSEHFEIMRGVGTIYSEENGEEYYDDFEFSFDIQTNNVLAIHCDESWKNYSAEIEENLTEDIIINDFVNYVKNKENN